MPAPQERHRLLAPPALLLLSAPARHPRCCSRRAARRWASRRAARAGSPPVLVPLLRGCIRATALVGRARGEARLGARRRRGDGALLRRGGTRLTLASAPGQLPPRRPPRRRGAAPLTPLAAVAALPHEGAPGGVERGVAGREARLAEGVVAEVARLVRVRATVRVGVRATTRVRVRVRARARARVRVRVREAPPAGPPGRRTPWARSAPSSARTSRPASGRCGPRAARAICTSQSRASRRACG